MSLLSAICHKAFYNCVGSYWDLIKDTFLLLPNCLLFGKCGRGLFDDASHIGGQVACEAVRNCSENDLPSVGDLFIDNAPTLLLGVIAVVGAKVALDSCCGERRPRRR